MIVVKNTDLPMVLKNINIEKEFLLGLKDSLALIHQSEPAVKDEIEAYIKNNAVLNGIATKAQREISSRHTLLETLDFGLNNGIALLDYIAQQFSASKVKVFDTATISFRQKGMFDWISSINFFGKYTSKLIDVVLTQPKTITHYLNKVDFEFINKTVGYYIIILKRLCSALKDIKRTIDMLSTETFSESEASLIEQIKGRQAVNLGLAPHNLNPMYWIRYGKMVSDVNTLKSNHEKIDMYAMKLQRLENRRNKTPDPAIDRQIEYWQNQIQILDAQIAQIEERYSDGI